MTKHFLALAAAATVALTACAPTPAPFTVGGAPMEKEKTIVENAAMADNLKTLVAGIRAAGLESTLSGPGPFTVFAPTDQAFAALPDDSLTALMDAKNADLLVKLLTYHVVPGKTTSAQMVSGMRLRTIEGHELVIETDGKGMMKVNGVPVSVADVPASNGVVFVIDAVLLPPVGDAPAPASSPSAAQVQAPGSSTAGQAGSVMVGVLMEKGVMYRVLDNGAREQMKTDMQLQNGIKVMTNGKLLSPDGREAMLAEGQLLTMSGEVGDIKNGLPQPAGTTSSAAPYVQPDSGKPAYGVFTEGVIGNGKTSVLFFHAAWCPVCRAGDAKIAELYAKEQSLTYDTYRVDYDTSGPLKQKYGVTYQHTFVVIDGTGKALKTVQNPSDNELLDMLRG